MIYIPLISLLYTTIPIEPAVEAAVNGAAASVAHSSIDLCSRLDRVLEEAVQARANPRYSWHFEVKLSGPDISSVSWRDCSRSTHSKRKHIFSVTEVKELIRFVVLNTFVTNGNCVRRQSVGIPMGTNAGPDFADLYLYSFEKDFIDNLERLNPDAARAFHLSFRKIDDLLSVDNPYASYISRDLADGGLYPTVLDLKNTTKSLNHVNFCGMNIVGVDQGFLISVYDKRDDFPFQVRNYPHISTNMPKSLIYAVFKSQLHRFYTMVNYTEAFLSAAAKLAAKLVTLNGFSLSRLKSLFRAFVSGLKSSKFRQPNWALIKSFCSRVNNLTPSPSIENVL